MSTCLKLGGKEMDKALKEMMYSKIIVEMKEVVKKGGDVLQYLSELRGDHRYRTGVVPNMNGACLQYNNLINCLLCFVFFLLKIYLRNFHAAEYDGPRIYT